VLIQSRNAHRQAFEVVLAPFGINDFQYDRFAGFRTVDVFRAVLRDKVVSPEDLETTAMDCTVRKQTYARRLLASGDYISVDCVSVLTRLSEYFPLALASSGSRASVAAFLDQTGVASCFRSVLSGDDVLHAKPDPELFRRSVQALGVRPETCVVVEDAVAGVQAARSAGTRVVGFGSAEAEELSAAGAECVVASLRELATLLGATERAG
jgi:beta-phosphoglucomutase